MSDYHRNVLSFLAQIDDAAVSGLLNRDLIVEANRLRLETQIEMGRTRVHGADSIDAIIFPDITEDRR